MSLVFEALQRLDGERTDDDLLPPSLAFESLRLYERRGAPKWEFASTELEDEDLQPSASHELRQRAIGAPLQTGGWNPTSLSGRLTEPSELPVPTPGPILVSSTEDSPLEVPAGVHRVLSAIRGALPFVQRILPLLEENFRAGATSLTAQYSQASSAQQLPPSVDLAPIDKSMTELRATQGELCDRIVEQNASIERIGDRVEMVREANDRNTLEQQELVEELKSVGTRINFVAILAFGLLTVSLVINLALFLHIIKNLP